MNNQVRFSLIALLSGVIAAFTWVLTEIIIIQFSTPYLVATMWGGLVGGLVLLAIAWPRGEISVNRWSHTQWLRIIIGGFLIHGIGFLLAFVATGLIGAGKANLLGQIQTFFVLALAVLFLGESLTSRQLMGVALAVVGVMLLNFDPSSRWVAWGVGESATIVARLLIAVGIVVMKPLFNHGNAAGTTGVAMLIGAAFLFGIYPMNRAVASEPAAPAIGWLVAILIIVVGIGRGLSWLCFNAAQQYIGASRAVILFLPYAFFTVLFQALAVWILPNSGIQLPQNLGMALVGGALITVGIIVLQTE